MVHALAIHSKGLTLNVWQAPFQGLCSRGHHGTGEGDDSLKKHVLKRGQDS